MLKQAIEEMAKDVEGVTDYSLSLMIQGAITDLDDPKTSALEVIIINTFVAICRNEMENRKRE